MNRIYTLKSVSKFERDFKKISKKDKRVAKRILKGIEGLKENPFSSGLETHSVKISSLGKVYSSRITGDIRIIWFFKSKGVIVLYRIGGHSGGSKVYR
jgi:mRNA-degrading endonuclease YafQ of YafQ-DinJ toxin-antitoxin module